MNISYENRNGKTYAYRSTSRRVPGKKNPVSIKEYLGVVDPSTGNILKTSRSNNNDSFKIDLCVKYYGNSLIVYTIAKELGLIDDIQEVFGHSASDIVSVALAYAMNQVSVDVLSSLVSSSYIGELSGRDSPMMTKKQVEEALNAITQQKIRKFFDLRYSRLGERVFFYVYLSYTPEGLDRPIRGLSNPNFSDSRISIIALAETGMPIGYGVISEKMREPRTLTEQLVEICQRYPDAILIPDTNLSPMLDLPLLITNGVNFALPFVGTSQRYRDVESEFRDISEQQYLKHFDQDEYYLKEGISEIRIVGEDCEAIPESDPRFSDTQHSIRTFMCYDPRMRRDAEKIMRSTLSNLKSNLTGNLSTDPEKDLVLTAGSYSRFLKVDLDDDGRMVISSRRKEIAEFHRDAGKTVVFLSTSEWDDVVSGRIARTRFAKALDAYYRESFENGRYRGTRVDSNPQFFIDYIMLSVYIEIQSRMEKKRVQALSVKDALAIASTYKLVINRKSRGYSRDRNVGRVLRILDIPDSIDSIGIGSNHEMDGEA